ncbi:MAG: sulfur transferase domain-containing protein [bacterium]
MIDAPFIDMPYARMPLPGVLTAGQPSGEQLQALAAAGYRTVVNTRGFGEPGVAEMPEYVAALGMRYVHIPMSGPDDVSLANARALAAALDGGLPALVHCASSNRVGALFALKAYRLDGQSAAEALQLGRAAGLQGLEPYVRMLLSQPR